EMVADDLNRPETSSQRVGDMGARAVPRLAALHQRQADIFLQRRRIAEGGHVADARARSVEAALLHDMRAAAERLAVERDDADEAEAVLVDQAYAVHERGADEGLLLRQHPVE